MKICEAGRSTGCCRNPDIRTINTMSADTAGNFEIRAGAGVGITTETNGIRIAYTGGITVYTNTDGNLVIDNDVFTIDLANDISIVGDLSAGGDLGIGGSAAVTGNASVDGNMTITGDLTVNGTYYTVHAEHVYTEDDYIIMRDGAVTGLGSGDYSGFQVKLYDGVNDGKLVIDNSGTARVGDVGDEQPLLTREESADLTDGALLKWDAANSKAIDEGTVGSDTKPVKIVNGVATEVTNELQTKFETTSGSDLAYSWVKYGKIVFMTVFYSNTSTGSFVVTNDAPVNRGVNVSVNAHDGNGNPCGRMYLNTNGGTIVAVCNLANAQNITSFSYLSD